MLDDVVRLEALFFGGLDNYRDIFGDFRFGRVFVPDTLRFSVKVLDGSGSQICRIGRYGNLDDGLGTARSKGGDAPIYTAWPHAVAVTDRMVYVADMINHRIVAAKLSAAAEETTTLR